MWDLHLIFSIYKWFSWHFFNVLRTIIIMVFNVPVNISKSLNISTCWFKSIATQSSWVIRTSCYKYCSVYYQIPTPLFLWCNASQKVYFCPFLENIGLFENIRCCSCQWHNFYLHLNENIWDKIIYLIRKMRVIKILVPKGKCLGIYFQECSP